MKEADIDAALRPLMRSRFQLGMFDPPERVRWAQIPYSANQAPAHDQLARRVSFVVRPTKDLRRFDPGEHTYVVDDGRYEARIGASSADIRMRKTFEIADAR